MEKTRFEIDPYNRLVLKKSGRKGDLRKFRKVLDDRFKIDDNNNLSYHIKSPLSDGENIPNQIRLKGVWSLTADHNLRLTLDKETRETFGDQIRLQGEILDVSGNSVLFAVTTKTKNKQSTYILNIAGSWKADENNRLSFYIKKEEGKYDILVFNGVWEVNKNHEIIYQYDKSHTLIFKGYWDIRDAFRIIYVLGAGTNSAFEFKTGVGIFREDSVKYELGIALAGRKKPVTRTICLFGKWNLKKDVGLVFEVEYETGRPHSIVFGAEVRLAGRSTVSFRLKNDAGNRDLGIDLKLSRDILKGGGESFLQLLKTKDESAIYAGAAWRW